MPLDSITVVQILVAAVLGLLGIIANILVYVLKGSLVMLQNDTSELQEEIHELRSNYQDFRSEQKMTVASLAATSEERYKVLTELSVSIKDLQNRFADKVDLKDAVAEMKGCIFDISRRLDRMVDSIKDSNNVK